MNSDANIAAHVFGCKHQWSTKPHWCRWFFYQCVVDDLCWHDACYQHCGKMFLTWIKLLHSSEKVKLQYCTYY